MGISIRIANSMLRFESGIIWLPSISATPFMMIGEIESNNVWLGIFTALTQIEVFWNMLPLQLIICYWCFEGGSCLHIVDYLESRGSRFLWNVIILLKFVTLDILHYSWKYLVVAVGGFSSDTSGGIWRSFDVHGTVHH